MLDRGNSGSLSIPQFSVSWTNAFLHPWRIGLKTVFGIQFYERDLIKMHYHGASGFAKAYVLIPILLPRTRFRTSCNSEQIYAVIIKGNNQIIAESANAFVLVTWIVSKPAVITKITDYLFMSGTWESPCGEKSSKGIFSMYVSKG